MKLSGFDKSRVIGSGTTLDTARLRSALSEKPKRKRKKYPCLRNRRTRRPPHSRTLSYALCGPKPIYHFAAKNRGITFDELTEIEDEVRNIAYKIIKAKEQLTME